MSRELLAREALAQIPKILTLQDRNQHSPTYGCCDRNFWHYRMIDFPSGMAQEFVWPLALAHHLDIPGNPFYRQAAVREWVQAGILYAARAAHADGSCDDYFPHERAGGATAFSLLACIESYRLLGFRNEAMLEFFERRGTWLAHHEESGRLTNHQALIVLCLELLSELVQSRQWDRLKERRLERVWSWQSPEGWFPEYEGCDPGYHTLTISLLARLYELRPTPRLKDSLVRAVGFAAQCAHPDGSYGGECGSRNTYNFFPHGFELVGRWMPEALSMNDRFLSGLGSGLGPCYADDHIIGHHTWNYFLAWSDFVEARPPLAPRGQGRIWFREAEVLIDRRETAELYLALNKGGAFKLFRDHKLVASDTQVSLQIGDGRIKNAVGHLVDEYRVQVGEDEIVIEGSLGWAKQEQMTPVKLVALRLLMLAIGRFFPNLIRTVLQRVLITGKRRAPFTFSRRLTWEHGTWRVTDEVQAESWRDVTAAGIGPDQTSIHVVMSRTFQMGQLQPWLDLTDKIRSLAPGQSLRSVRDL
jgi:hypothetical protein